MTAVTDHPNRDANGTMTSGGSVRRLSGAMAPDLATHLATVGRLPALGDRAALLAEVRASGLTGHGGAAFATWRKLETVAAGRNPVIVANGAEGEPASSKDRALLAHAPHLVLDGVQVAAAVTGATEAYAYVRASSEASVRRALAERSDAVPVRVVTAAESFISGQETAVVAAIEGAPPLPRDVPDLVVRRGVRGRATLVQNVETLAHVALVARYGSAWFRQLGTEAQPGTFLASVSGAVHRPGVHEVAYGVALGEVIEQAGGASEPVQAVLVGGYHGVWLPADAVSAPMSVEGLAPWGAGPGAGVVLVLGRSESGLAVTARIAAYLAGEGARQCGPCLNGLPAMATVLGRMARGERDADLPRQVEWLTRVVEGRGACHHPDGTARMVRSALEVFGP
jgi:NADH:ubiquinone oxidoreductase subunit F (NADH-binding)